MGIHRILIIFIVGMVLISCDTNKTDNSFRDIVTFNKDRNGRKVISINIKGNSNDQDDTNSYEVKKHLLKQGETLQDLAYLYGADYESILRANSVNDFSELKVGQVILIPIKKSN